MCGAVSLSAFMFVPQMSSSADAATFSEVNASSVFVKQQKSDTCTLASNVMLLRRTAMMRGDSDWASITESACRSTLWYEGVGMYHYYTYKDIDVSYQYLSSSQSVSTQLINALKEHPEGIVVYDTDYPHAILLTDYTDGVFYCADPANNVPSGRIKASRALISISNVDTYWYVSSPDVSFGSGENTSSVNEKWKISASNGVNMRSGAGTSYSVVGGIPYNTTVTVTKKTTSGGYTWGYTAYNGVSGWFALDYAVNVSDSSSSLTNNSKISTSSITLGNSVLLTASAAGGTSGYTYAFYYKKPNASSWNTLKNYSSAKTMPLKPSMTGSYQICIKVKDGNGSIAKKYFTLTVKSAGLRNTSTLSASSITLGNSILVNGSAKGGASGYTYACYYKKSSSTEWTGFKTYSSVNTVPFKPSSTGRYDICVMVQDKNGTIAKRYYTLTVKSAGLTNNSKISSSSITLGKSVKITASASGGTSSYKYAYYYKKSTDTSWTWLKGYTSTASVSFKPDQTGTYNICVKVKDSDGTVANRYYNITVTN